MAPFARQQAADMNPKTPEKRSSSIGLSMKKPHEIALTLLFLVLCAFLLLAVVIALATNERIWNEVTELIGDT